MVFGDWRCIYFCAGVRCQRWCTSRRRYRAWIFAVPVSSVFVSSGLCTPRLCMPKSRLQEMTPFPRFVSRHGSHSLLFPWRTIPRLFKAVNLPESIFQSHYCNTWGLLCKKAQTASSIKRCSDFTLFANTVEETRLFGEKVAVKFYFCWSCKGMTVVFEVGWDIYGLKSTFQSTFYLCFPGFFIPLLIFFKVS